MKESDTGVNPSEKSIAKGDKLTKETFDNFVSRLRHDCVGDGVKKHYTADAIFIIQSKQILYGIDKEYSDQLAIIVDEEVFHSIKEYWKSLHSSTKRKLNRLAQQQYESTFLRLYSADQYSIIKRLPEHTVTGWDERWEYVCAHLTYNAAEAFIRRKKHDHRELRIYVESQSYCWEYNAIIDGLINGKIAFTDDSPECGEDNLP